MRDCPSFHLSGTASLKNAVRLRPPTDRSDAKEQVA